MKQFAAFFTAAFVAFAGVPAFADQTIVGITLNATTGHHVESDRAESIPLLPLPMLEIDRVHRDFRLHLEGVPPIGPVALSQPSQYVESMSPRVSYVTGEVQYAPVNRGYAFGIGETVLNQVTEDHVPFFQTQPSPQYSRVVGMRLSAAARLYGSVRNRLEAAIAVNPSMHGLQDGRYAEYASLVDSQLRWTSAHARFDLSYGLRYLNYTAAYSYDHALGDRNHLFMPFVGFQWYGKQERRFPSSPLTTAADPPATRRASDTTVGLTLLGTNGNRTATEASSDVPLNFALAPDIEAAHRFGRYEVDAETILSNASSNPFGASGNRWSYISAEAVSGVGRGPFSAGLGETVTNIEPAHPSALVTAGSRSAGVDLIGRWAFATSLSSRSYVQFRVEPYAHIASSVTIHDPNGPSRSSSSTAHGARIDATLQREVELRRIVLSYGLRYMNQTTNYYSLGAEGVYLTRSTSLMPFAGISVRY